MGDNAGASKAQADLSSLTLKKIGPFWVLIFGQVKTKLPSPINVQQELSLKVENNAAFIRIDNEIKYEVIVNDVGNISLKSVVEDTPLSPQNDVNPQVEAEQPDPIAQSVSDVDNKAQYHSSNEQTAAFGNQHEKQPSDDLSKSELSNLQNKDQPLNESEDDTHHGGNDEEESDNTPKQKNEITAVGTIDDKIGNDSYVLGKEHVRANTETTIETEFNQCPEEDTPSRVTDQERNLHEDVSNISEINAISCQVEGATDEIVDDAKARTDSQTNKIEEQQLSNGNIEDNPTKSFCEEKPDDSFRKITDPEDIKLTDGRNVTDCPNDDSTIAGELNTEHSQLETHANAATARDTSSLRENIHQSATKSEYNDGSLQQERELLEIRELGPDKVQPKIYGTSESASPSTTSECNTDLSKEIPEEKRMLNGTGAEREHRHDNPVHVKGTTETEPCLTMHNTTKEHDTKDVELSEDGNVIHCKTNQEAYVLKDTLQQTQTHVERVSAYVVTEPNTGQWPDRADSPDISPKSEYGGNTNVTSGASLTKDKTIETRDTSDENDAETLQNHHSQYDANKTTDKPDENETETRQHHQSQDDANETTGTLDENDAETRQNHQSQYDVNKTTNKPDENEANTRQHHQNQDNVNKTTDTLDEKDTETRQNHHSQDDVNKTTGTLDENEAETRQHHQSQDDVNKTTGTLDENDTETRQHHQSQNDANKTTGKPEENDAETRQHHQSQDNVNKTTGTLDENEAETRQHHQSQDDVNKSTGTLDEYDTETRQHHQSQDDANKTTDKPNENDAETRQNHHSQDDVNKTTDTLDEKDAETRQKHQSQDDSNGISGTSSGEFKKSTSDVSSVSNNESQNKGHYNTVGKHTETDEPNPEPEIVAAKVNVSAKIGAEPNNWNFKSQANECCDIRINERPTNIIIISDASSSANKTEYTPDGEQLLNTCESTEQKEHGSADTGTTSDNDLNKSRKELKTAVTSKKHTKAADISTGSAQTDASNRTQQIITPQTVVSFGPEVAPNDYQRNSTDENTLDKCETDEQFALSVSTKDDDIDEEMDACNAQHLTMKRKNDMETPKSKRQCGFNEQEYKTSGDNNINDKPRSRETSQSTGNTKFVEQIKRQLYPENNTSADSKQEHKPSAAHPLDQQLLATAGSHSKHNCRVTAKSTYISKGNSAAKKNKHEDVQTDKTTKECATTADGMNDDVITKNDSGDEVQNKTEKQTKENDPAASRTSTTTKTTSNRNIDHTQINNNATALQPSRRAAQTNQTSNTEASRSEALSATRQATTRTFSNGQDVRCQYPAAETDCFKDRKPIARHHSCEAKTVENHTEETIELEHIWSSLFDHFEIQKSLHKRFSVQMDCRVTRTHFKCVVSGKANEVEDAIGAFRGEFIEKRVCKAMQLKFPVEVFSKTDILKLLNKQIKECLVILSESPESQLLLYTFDKLCLQNAEVMIRRYVTQQRVDVAKLLIDSEDFNHIANELSTKERGVLLRKDKNATIITVIGLTDSVNYVVNEIAAKLREYDTLAECERIAIRTVPIENRKAFAVIKTDIVFLDRLRAQGEVDISPIEFQDKQGFEIKGTSEQISYCETEIKEYTIKVRSSLIECGDNRIEMYIRSKEGQRAIDDVAKYRRVLISCRTKVVDERQNRNKETAFDGLDNSTLRVIVEEGALNNMNVDVIVNTTSINLDLKTGAVSSAILKSAGADIQTECYQKYPNGINIGEIAKTGGHRLKCRYVFHGSIRGYAVGFEEMKSRQNLRLFVHNCLCEATTLNLTTIAFPAIGTGNLGYPVHTVADEMFNCVKQFEQNCKQTSLKRIYFVIYPTDHTTIEAFRKKEKQECRQNAQAPSAVLSNHASETATLELHIHGYDANVKLAETDIQLKFKDDVPKSQCTVSMCMPREVSELFKQTDRTSGQCYRLKLQQELNKMDVTLVDAVETLEVTANDTDILKEGSYHICKFCKQHFNAFITLEGHYRMEEKTYDVGAVQYSLFAFYNSEILKQCQKDKVNVYLTGNTLVIEGRLEKVVVAKTKIHQIIDTIENNLCKENIDIGNNSGVINIQDVVDQFQETTATVCCMFSPELKSLTCYGHLKDEVKRVKLAFSEHLRKVKRQQHENQNLNVGKNTNVRNTSPSVMTSYSNAVTNRTKNKDIFTCVTQERLSVKVYEADILSVNVDCIVNAANTDLKHVSGIARVIADKAGQDLVKECKKYHEQYGQLRVGKALKTSAGNLQYKCVIHAVGPRWADYLPYTDASIQRCQLDLSDAVRQSLDVAVRNHMTSIAFPAISSAAMGVPKELCAAEFAKAIMVYSNATRGKRDQTLREVHFVDKDPNTIQIIKETFSVMIRDQKTSPHSFKKYIVQIPTVSQHGQGSRASELPPRNKPHTANVETPNTFGYPLYIMSKTEIKCKFTDRHTLRIYTGDILNVHDADTIVCGEDTSGSSKGYIAKRLTEIGKWEYVEDKNGAFSKTKPLIGDVVITKGGKSQFERVAHALVPHRQQFPSETEWKKSLRKMYDRIFGETSRDGALSLVLPLLGTGASNADLNTFIAIFLDSYTVACNRHQTNPLTVSMVNIENSKTQTIVEVFLKHIDKVRNFTRNDPANELPRRRTDRKGESCSGQPKTGHDNIDKYAKGASAANPPGGQGRHGTGAENQQKFTGRSRRVTVDSCVICLDGKINNPKRLICGHTFCKKCIDSKFKVKPICPTCDTVCGTITGNQPEGKMEISRSYLNLTGYEGNGSINITYTFPSGKQSSNYPRPRASYTGFKRFAYLPDNEKGQKICAMLRKAFNQKLVFTICTSRTTGHESVITWNDIHHKTDLRSNTQYGYPDATYLTRVTDELRAKGVTESDIDQNFLRRLKTLQVGQKLYNL